MAEPQLPTDVYNHLSSGRSPLELLMGGGAPYNLARLQTQLITDAMRNQSSFAQPTGQKLPPSRAQMAGSAPYSPVCGAGTRPNSDVTLEAINSRLPAGKGTTLDEIGRLYETMKRNLQGPRSAY